MAQQQARRTNEREESWRISPVRGPYPDPSGQAQARGGSDSTGRDLERDAGESRRSTFENAALLLGRAVFGGYFLYNGINHFLHRDMMAGYAGSKGVTAPDLAVTASGAMLVAGGASILAGAWPKAGAALISAFLLGVSPQMHAFWEEEDQQRRMQEMVNFMKNMALLGATLLVAAHPEPWPLAPASSAGLEAGGY